jgi:hypothetical protein
VRLHATPPGLSRVNVYLFIYLFIYLFEGVSGRRNRALHSAPERSDWR